MLYQQGGWKYSFHFGERLWHAKQLSKTAGDDFMQTPLNHVESIYTYISAIYTIQCITVPDMIEIISRLDRRTCIQCFYQDTCIVTYPAIPRQDDMRCDKVSWQTKVWEWLAHICVDPVSSHPGIPPKCAKWPLLNFWDFPEDLLSIDLPTWGMVWLVFGASSLRWDGWFAGRGSEERIWIPAFSGGVRNVSCCPSAASWPTRFVSMPESGSNFITLQGLCT